MAALAGTGHPPADATGDKWQFRLFDTLLLDIMQRRGETTRDIFRQLFERNPVERIFRFLDEHNLLGRQPAGDEFGVAGAVYALHRAGTARPAGAAEK